MKRKLITVLAGLSLAVCVASAVFWVRSLRFTQSQVGESLSFRRTDPRWWVVSRHGKLTLCRQDGRDWGKEKADVKLLGFQFALLKSPCGSLMNFATPYWFLTGATALPPAGWAAVRYRRRRRERSGLCLRCGYDLRGSAHSGRCPECGAPVAVPAAQPSGYS